MDGQKTLDTIRAIETAESAEDVLSTFSSFVEQFGFTGVMIGHLVDPDRTGTGPKFGFSDWPTELMQLRRDKMAFTHDPIIKYALRTQRPFRWSTAYEHATRFGIEVSEDVRDFGMDDGLMLPMIEIDSLPGGISLGGKFLDFDDTHIPHIQLAAQHAFFKLQAMFGPFPFEASAELTRKETDVLHFAASGKTAWETSIILGMTETAVKDALKRASRKLDAANKTHAVANAMARRIII